MNEELQKLDPDCKCKLYLQRNQTFNTPRVQVFRGVRIKNIPDMLIKHKGYGILTAHITIGSSRKGEAEKFIKLNLE